MVLVLRRAPERTPLFCGRASREASGDRLPWYDAPLWACAEHYGLAEILSEDFEHGRRYGTVRVRSPFVDLE